MGIDVVRRTSRTDSLAKGVKDTLLEKFSRTCRSPAPGLKGRKDAKK
jgi:hypothetical protein